MKNLLIGTAAVAVATMTNPALGDDSGINPTWKDLQYWHIGVVRNTHDCFMLSTYMDNGGGFRVALQDANKSLEVYLGKPLWASLQPGQQYPIKLQFDNQNPWVANAKAFDYKGSKILSFHVPNKENFVQRFASELTSSSGVKVYYQDQQIASWGLRNSGPAFDEMMACETAMTSQRVDPFQPTTAPQPTDPFQHL